MKVANPDKIADGRIYADYIDWRAKNPSDDLMTALLNVEFEDENGVTRKLTRNEVLHYTQVVAGAGNETTGRLIGWLAKVLAEHPDQRREVFEDRSLLTRAVDETLRFEPTGPHVARYSSAISSATAPRCPLVVPCCCCSGPPTVIRAGTPTRTPSTSTATTSLTSPSARACTTAWGRIWLAWKVGSLSMSCSTAGPNGHRLRTASNGANLNRPRLELPATDDPAIRRTTSSITVVHSPVRLCFAIARNFVERDIFDASAIRACRFPTATARAPVRYRPRPVRSLEPKICLIEGEG